MADFCDYIVYADESGHHELNRIDVNFPVFCLAFVVVKKTDYIEKIVPAIQRLKFDFWGHDWVVLHAHDIRKQKNAFSFLRLNRAKCDEFFNRLNNFVEGAPFQVISAVIRKDLLIKKYPVPHNPYNVALKYCLERLLRLMCDQHQQGKEITLVFERRGVIEDKELEIEFNKIILNKSTWGYRNDDFSVMNFKMLFAGKAHNSTGMQLADLIAHPIAVKAFRPEQNNRSYDIIKNKYSFAGHKKIFPDPEPVMNLED